MRMNIKEKAAYVKGLFSGLDLDSDKKETKLLKAMVELMEDISLSLENLEEDVDDICDQLDVLDEDLSEVEDEIYDECECDDECDDDCDCGCHSDENFYEVSCPSCNQKICLSEEALLDDEMNCPNCGELLEFDLSDIDGCECDDCCECEPKCECSHNCDDEK
jgi:hypothetical protein